MSLRRRLVTATIAGLLIGAAMVALFSQNQAAPVVQIVRAKAVQAMNLETLSRPGPLVKREIASSSAMNAQEEPAQFDCLASLHEQIEDYDLFMRRLETELSPIVGSWFFYHDEDLNDVRETTASGLFLLGLANAGLLEGNPSAPDVKRAIENLKRAHQLDPKNSAPLVFLAYLSDQRDSPEAARKYREALALTTHFDSYILTISNAAYETMRSPSDLMNVSSVMSSVSIPNYMILGKYLKAQNLIQVADQMVAAQNFDGEQDIDYILVEGAIGVSTIKKLQPERTESLPSIQNVIQKLKEQPMTMWDTMPIEDCNLSHLEPDLKRIREHLDAKNSRN